MRLSYRTIHAAEALLHRRRNQPFGHLIDHAIRHNAVPRTVATLALLNGNVEEDCFDVAIVESGELDVRAALLGSQVSRVDVRYGAFQLQAMLEQGPQYF